MGNVLSVHAEIFLAKRNNLISNPAMLLNEILSFQQGKSYNGCPMFIKEYWDNKSIQISFTSKYEPTALFKFSQKYRSSIDKIFARTFDETGDWDNIIELPNEEFEFDKNKRKCKYAFNEIRYKPNNSIEYSSQQISGLMNSCSNLINQENRDIVNLPIEYLDNLKTYNELQIESNDIRVIETIVDESSDIIFLNDKITVHRKIDTKEYMKQDYATNNSEFMAVKYNKSKYDLYSAGWLNCADENYLAYLKKRRSAS